MFADVKIGFVGCGNMAIALICGISDKLVAKENIFAYAPNAEKLNQNAKSYGFIPAASSIEVCEKSDYVILAVKPIMMAKAISECTSALEGKAVISIAAGVATAELQALLPQSATVLRVMPNTPALVGAGATAMCNDTTTFTNEQKTFAKQLFDCTGSAMWVDERLMDAVVGVSGSGPAYVFMFIEAMEDGGVRAGLPRTTARELAIQTVIGSGLLAQKTGLLPGQLKDMVCSPGGTTIDAVASLEKNAFRGTVIEAIQACVNKSIAMGKKN